ncbi:signal transduction histidine kinase [Anseongella ginsenosidimutans]|uniref:histidine kinase n=1 Tax=Anseongella ginsenosidimutans TaxID=496056 RepID=A0A4R3KW24_9SPHI|nr:hybrid sensor histidine kinase/response regulator transcription factor [Anseongella ginsenosidimutans]QEC51367.1 response regulator [Anseongella ginsenosidimutans]TCS89929.1 signal transduction histidine kinase [Anseongella ginsenosidimutans]
MRYVYILIFFLSFSCLRAVSQEIQYQFAHLDISNGLSHNQVNCILKDKKGFMWFGTMSGLNRYDGYTIRTFKHDLRDSSSISDNYISNLFEGPLGDIWVETLDGINIYHPETGSFTRDIGPALKKLSLPDAHITDMMEDSRGNYWFAYSTSGLYRYSPASGATTSLHPGKGDKSSLSSSSIAAIEEDNEGNFWIFHADGMLELLDGKSFGVIYRNNSLAGVAGEHTGEISGPDLFIDAENDLWIYFRSTAGGIYYFNTTQKVLSHFSRSSGRARLNNDIITGIVQDSRGLIWIGTDHGGINLIDKRTFSVRQILYNEDDKKSLSQNSIYSLYKDDEGIIWAGTYKKGVNYYHESIVKFPHYQHQRSNPESLPFNDINAFVEDEKGNLWIGTNGGGLLYFDREKNSFRQFLHDPSDPGSLSNDVIVCLCLDHQGKLWIGTYYGGLNCYDGDKFIHYKHDPERPESLSDNRVWEIIEDSRHNLWIGTLNGGLNLFDRESNIFSHYKSEDPNSVTSNYIADLTEDAEGNLWVGTSHGINVLDQASGKFSRYLHQAGEPGSLSNNNVVTIMEDSRGLVWAGTREGLNLMDKQRNSFRVFRKEDGLSDNTVLGILEAENGDLWISTTNGISRLTISRKAGTDSLNFRFKNFDEADGLQGKAFNENAELKTGKGELVFGGANGFNIIDPANIHFNKSTFPVVLTELQLFNREVKAGDTINGRVLLSRSITETKSVTFKHTEDVISLEFAALSFFHPQKTRYAYILEGFNDHWLTTDARQRKITYTNLDPGEYRFRIKAANNEGAWSEDELLLLIRVLPPFWETPLAFLIYALLIIATLLLARRFILERERIKFRLAQERTEAQRMHELDMMKIRFLTNVSHEFRTPISLILSPVEKLVRHADSPADKNHLLMIQRNARRLLNLVNQLLDFRKIEVQELRLNLAENNVVQFVREITASFSDVSENKNVTLSFCPEIQDLHMAFDADKLEKILFNLLSNAFKFTPCGGSIQVKLGLQPAAGSGEQQLKIQVIDNGIGIPADKQEKVFERFFQSELPASILNQGSGIGLSIAREFAQLHKGTIHLRSHPGKGSCFTVLLPLEKSGSQGMVRARNRPANGLWVSGRRRRHEINLISAHGRKKSQVLLVEDNEDFRFYLKDGLEENFIILEAGNGTEGWEMAAKHIPDIVVSDIMMPGLNGMELCRKIKSDRRTSHVPVILLTALAEEEQELEGLETGADDYVTKPFSFDVLLLRIKNLVAQRELVRKSFQKHMEIKPSEVSITPLDESLIQKAIALVEENIANADFSVEDLSGKLNMSRVALYKKLLSLTGKSPIEFIRVIRLKRAAQLLGKSQLTVSEIAYQVGFNNPKYFTQYFKKEFNIPPSRYQAEKLKEG